MTARVPRPTCDVDRAYRELLGHPRSDTRDAASVCSPEPPERRDYPAAAPPRVAFVLCNGHLRDLFDELARADRPPTVPS